MKRRGARVGGTRQRPFAVTQYRRGQARRTREEQASLSWRHTNKTPLEQLAYDPPPKLPLELARTSEDGPHSQRLGTVTSGCEQPRLADPRRALDHEHPARPGRGGNQRLLDRRQLGLSLQELDHAATCPHRRIVASALVEGNHRRAIKPAGQRRGPLVGGACQGSPCLAC
jgi:hypothetical protein